MSAWEKSRASEKKSCQQKKVAPTKKSRTSEEKSCQQKSRASKKEVSPQVRKCAPKYDAHMYDAVRTHVWHLQGSV